MMKKVVPLSVLVASAMGVTTVPSYVPGSWTIATTPSGASANCCYITSSPLTISNLDAAVFSGTVTAGQVGCTSTNSFSLGGTATTLPLTLDIPTTSSATSPFTATVAGGLDSTQAAGASFTVSPDGSTLSYVPKAATTTACVAQTFTRTTQAAISNVAGTYTVGAATGTGTATCCALDTATDLVIATSGTKTTATGKYATSANCATAPALTGATYTKDLAPGASSTQATDYLSLNNDLFTYNSETNTITYVPEGKTAAACSQTLTKQSSSAHKLAVPAVVGAAVLGLVVV